MFNRLLKSRKNHPMQLAISKLVPSFYLNKSYNNPAVPKTASRVIFLSFDCDKDIDIKFLDKILMILNESQIKANFAIPAYYLKNNSQQINKIIQTGHELLNHSFSHPDDFVDLDLEMMKNEIKKADLEFNNVIGYRCRGLRAPHFGWLYYAPEKFIQMIEFLKEIGYRYSSSTVLSWFTFTDFKKITDVLRHLDFIEFPLAPNPIRPLEPFDSYYFFKNNRSGKTLTNKQMQYFLSLFCQVINKSIQYNIPINVYFDPQDVIKNHLIGDIIKIIQNNRFVSYRYSDFN